MYTLHPGDLIFTGTPEGVSPIRRRRQHRGHDREHRHAWRLPSGPKSAISAPAMSGLVRRSLGHTHGRREHDVLHQALAHRRAEGVLRSSRGQGRGAALGSAGRDHSARASPRNGPGALALRRSAAAAHGSGPSAHREGSRAARARPREPWTPRQVARRPAASTSVCS